MELFSIIIGELFEGFGNTLLLFAVTLVFALVLGLLLSFGAMSKFKPIKYLVAGIVWIIRGTPLMLQVLLVSFIPKYVFGVYTKDFAAALGLSINATMFFFVAVAAAFVGLMLRVVKNVMESAVAIKEENELTI